MFKTIFLLASLLFSISLQGQETLYDLPIIEQNAEQTADQLFEEGSYKESLEIYLSLAKLGDKYSQYMASMQYLHGLGVDNDLFQAYGWANLARKSESEEAEEYYQQIKASINSQEMQRAEEVKLQIYKDYNDIAIAMKLKEMIRNTIPKCVGSRIPGNCSFVQHYCVESGTSRKSYQKCLREVSIRNPRVIRNLKQDLANTDDYIEEQLLRAGTVTIEEVDNTDTTEGSKPEVEQN